MRTIAICILALLVWNHSAGQNILRDRVEQTYTAQIGVVEQGHNAGAEVERYLSTVGFSKGAPWCAAFVAWVYTESGVKNPKSAWSPAWFTKGIVWDRGQVKSTIPLPLPGDVFGIYYPEKGRIAHVGFVHRFNTSITLTVEGNTNKAGSREGDGVYMKRRPTRQIYQVACYINN